MTNLKYLNTSEVTNMYGMFMNCKLLTSLDVSGFNTSKVTDMNSMFKGCEKLTSLDVSGFNTSNVTSMAKMFMECKSLTSLDVSGFNTSKVTDMKYMFYQCSYLESLDASGFNTSKVTDMLRMFCGCYRLESLDVSGFNTSNVTNMNEMFFWCNYLTTLDVRSFNTSNVTDMNSMFYNCSSLTTIYCNDSWNSSCPSNDMFGYCTNLKGAISYNESKTTAAYANPTTGYFTYKLNTYSLTINGTQVTDVNAPNLASINGVNGSVKFDDAAKTLTLTDAVIYTNADNTSAIQTNLDSLYIVVNGECMIGSLKLAGIAGTSHVVIKGDGKLTVVGKGAVALYMDSNSLTVADGVQLDIQGHTQYGINGCKALKVNGKDTKLRVYGATGSCTNVESMILSDNLAIMDPLGAKYSNGTIVDIDGNEIQRYWVTIEYAEPYILGDVNGDGSITMADANMVVNYFLATDPSSIANFNVTAADVNGDKSITMADANQIVNMFLGQ
ncbi:MAG: BspA family leucine-rich repeat surface protein [Prevotella sp.]|nr:BspA family leucine-rich repeat surface protein [Prevotella sp.]